MMRSLYSGVSGLKIHQTRMDVIGNNISNVNTVGFKSSNVTFADVLYQTSQSATGPDPDSGRAGQNAKQIGLGGTVSSISTQIEVSGGSQRTDNAFDMMIEGSAFFIVNNGSGNYFTKAGSFKVDSMGTLCNAAGYAVMGWQVDPKNPLVTSQDTVSPLRIQSAENMYSAPECTEAIYFSGNIDSKDNAFDSETGKKTAFTIFDNLGRSYTVNITLNQVGVGTTDVLESEYSVQITDIVDSNGDSVLKRQKPDGTWEAVTGVKFGFGSLSDTGGFAGDLSAQITVDPATGNISGLPAAARLGFNKQTGKFKYVIPPNGTNFADAPQQIAGNDYDSVQFHLEFGGTTDDVDKANPFPDTIDVDFSTLTMYANSGSTNIAYTKGDLDGLKTGRAAGNMTGCSVDTAGMIYGVYDNGTTRLLGQIAVATFANPAGLEAVGGSLFATTQNSGEFDGIGKSINSTGGQINTGVLEMSNVDLSTEFTNMITTQRGFQANSRIITTSDTLLEELINLKR